MKQLLVAVLFLGHSLAWATCEPNSPEMGRFLSQRNWQPYQLRDDSGLPPVNGYTDGQGRFYFDDLSRKGDYTAQIKIDPSNKSYKEFFTDCRSPERKGGYLRSMRRNGENNRYQLSFRYLPKFNGITNDPVADQGLRDVRVDLNLKFDSSSILNTQDYSPVKTIADVTKVLRSQLEGQTEMGVYTFDLTGWDDVVCDLIQGKASLTINKFASSKAPLVQQKRVVEPDDVATLARALKTQQQKALTKEQAIYVAARTQSRLENDRQIRPVDNKLGFKIVQSLMDPTMSQFLNPTSEELMCVGDQLQSYAEEVLSHVFGISVKFPSLDELNP